MLINLWIDTESYGILYYFGVIWLTDKCMLCINLQALKYIQTKKNKRKKIVIFDKVI